MFPVCLRPSLFTLCLCPCPSFIRIFQLTFKRRAFPLRCCDCLRLTDPAPSCPEPGLYWWQAPAISSIFAPLSITITFCQLRLGSANGSQSRRQQPRQQSKWSLQVEPPTRVCRARQWKNLASLWLKPYWNSLCIFVYSINRVLGYWAIAPFRTSSNKTLLCAHK